MIPIWYDLEFFGCLEQANETLVVYYHVLRNIECTTTTLQHINTLSMIHIGFNYVIKPLVVSISMVTWQKTIFVVASKSNRSILLPVLVPVWVGGKVPFDAVLVKCSSQLNRSYRSHSHQRLRVARSFICTGKARWFHQFSRIMCVISPKKLLWIIGFVDPWYHIHICMPQIVVVGCCNTLVSASQGWNSMEWAKNVRLDIMMIHLMG